MKEIGISGREKQFETAHIKPVDICRMVEAYPEPQRTVLLSSMTAIPLTYVCLGPCADCYGQTGYKGLTAQMSFDGLTELYKKYHPVMPHNLTHFMISEITDWRDGDLRFADVYALHRQYFPSDYYFASTRLPPGEEGTIADLIIAMMENYLKNDRPIHHLFDRLQISLEERDPIDRERQRSFKERQVNLIKQMVIQKIGTKYTSAVEKFMRERICIVNPKIERLPIGRAYKYDPDNAKSLFSAVGIMSDDHVALTTEGFRWYTTEAVGPLAPGGFKSGLVSAGSTWSFPANHDGPKMADALDAIFINEFGGSTTHKAIFNLPLRLITNEGPLVHTYLARDIGALAIFMDQMAELESSDRIHPLSSDGMKGLMLDAFEDYLTVKNEFPILLIILCRDHMLLIIKNWARRQS